MSTKRIILDLSLHHPSENNPDNIGEIIYHNGIEEHSINFNIIPHDSEGVCHDYAAFYPRVRSCICGGEECVNIEGTENYCYKGNCLNFPACNSVRNFNSFHLDGDSYNIGIDDFKNLLKVFDSRDCYCNPNPRGTPDYNPNGGDKYCFLYKFNNTHYTYNLTDSIKFESAYENKKILDQFSANRLQLHN
jgi:hypothetical protein